MSVDRPVASVRRSRRWSPVPPPTFEPISPRRAYTEVLLVFLAFFASGVAAAGLSLGRRLPTHSGSWAVYGPAAVDALAQAGVASTLVVLLSRNRGISRQAFGLSVLRTSTGDWAVGRMMRAATWALVAFIGGSLVTSALATGHYDHPAHPNIAFVFYSAAASLNAGVVEEIVVLGFVLVTLHQARRPLPEIIVVALLLRASYHLYYGPGVLGIFVWAGVFIWLYLRTRSLIPLIVVHFFWDLTIFLTLRWTWVAGIGVLVVLSLLIASPITWLVERSQSASPAGRWAGYAPMPAITAPWPGAAPSAPPGWQPDPTGETRWRWWDGYCWTNHTSL